MRIGIVNNNNRTNVSSSKNNIAFQAKNMSLEQTLQVVKEANKALIRGEEDPNKLKNILRKTVKKLNENEWSKIALFDIDFAKKKGVMTKALKSGNIEKQIPVLDDLFMLREKYNHDFHYLNIVNNYFTNKVIPFVKESKNKELAGYILNVTDKAPNQRSLYSIGERISLLKELGSKDNIKELNTYAFGNNSGFAEFMIRDSSYEVEKINKMADSAIEKLSTNPNF